ncbi:DNA-directed RNA polymerase III complex subunit Rpc25, partial [Mycoemilia scoparia]
MYILSRVRDNLKILPEAFGKSREDAIRDEVNKKYSNRVLHDVGLCICLFDIEEMGDEFLEPTEGNVWVKTTFRLLVFRPILGEVLVGKIRSASPAGLKVSLGFFDDVIIPEDLLPENRVFDSNEGVWIWKLDGNDFYMDVDETIRVRVVDEAFIDANPPRQNPNNTAEPAPMPPPYAITCTIAEEGLGLTSCYSTTNRPWDMDIIEAQAQVETLAEDILTDKQLSVDYDKRRNENRQAIRALKKPDFGKKATLNMGEFFIDLPKTKAIKIVEEDQKELEKAINDVRDRIKEKTQKLYNLE